MIASSNSEAWRRLFCDAVLADPVRSLRQDPKLFVSVARSVLLFPDESTWFLDALLEAEAVAPSSGTGDDWKQAVERLRNQGLGRIEPRDLAILVSSSESFAAACKALDDWAGSEKAKTDCGLDDRLFEAVAP